MRIGVFDSGLGGINVLKTLIRKYPNNEYIYLGDNLNLPYGDKSKEEIIELSSKCVSFLMEFNVDMIIIACGTISVNSLGYLKSKYDIPIYGIVDPVIDYLNSANYTNIGVIATKATIDSHIFKNNIDKNVIEIATPKLVPMIENNDFTDIDKVLHEYLDEYKDKIDILVLGCTHYPTLIPYLNRVLSDKVKLLDMSTLLLLNDGNKADLKIFFSKVDDSVIKNTRRILESDYIKINVTNSL